MTSETNTDQENCVFCKIVEGSIPAKKVYEDAETVAFLDISPIQHGHTLVIPKDHFENIYTLPAETWLRLQMTVQKVALAVKQATDADGINIAMNNESAAGQEVPHAHIHVIPRFNEDGLSHWPHIAYKSPEDMEAYAEKISEAMKE